MSIYIEEDVTKIFEELDRDKAWLLEVKENKFLVNFILDHINYLEDLVNNIVIVKE